MSSSRHSELSWSVKVQAEDEQITVTSLSACNIDKSPKGLWVRGWNGYITKHDFPPPSPIDFGPIADWSRGFWSNSRGFSLVESLHWSCDLAIATASTACAGPRDCKLLTCILEKNLVQKWKEPKLLKIAWNGVKIDRKCFLKFLTNIFTLEFSLAVGSCGSHNRKRFALVAKGNHCH